ncbi:hypothetical protein [Lysinibacillus fusiformis]|uniref:hypothetical protein n=1 Tax=Lysinibacillus fusiformis TaxID=28031 RepID=UPI00046A442A|nr:hypothetical protein [Lysinibacillus fusiformis]
MLIQLQTAYGQALNNLVFVDFVEKKVIGGLETLEIELAKENACCKDLIIAINHLFRKGDIDLAKERINALTKRADYIERLEYQVKAHRRNKLCEIASQFENGKVSVKRYDEAQVKGIKKLLNRSND